MTLEERVEFLHRSIESHDRQLGQLTDKVDGLSGMMGKLLETVKTIAEATLSHERRIDNLEGRS
jgi:hypothetical protein